MARYQEDLEWVRSLLLGCKSAMNRTEGEWVGQAGCLPRNDYSLAMKCAHRIYSLRAWCSPVLFVSGCFLVHVICGGLRHRSLQSFVSASWNESSRVLLIFGLQENLDRAKERVQSFVDRERLFGPDPIL